MQHLRLNFEDFLVADILRDTHDGRACGSLTKMVGASSTLKKRMRILLIDSH